MIIHVKYILRDLFQFKQKKNRYVEKRIIKYV